MAEEGLEVGKQLAMGDQAEKIPIIVMTSFVH